MNDDKRRMKADRSRVALHRMAITLFIPFGQIKKKKQEEEEEG